MMDISLKARHREKERQTRTLANWSELLKDKTALMTGPTAPLAPLKAPVNSAEQEEYSEKTA